MMTPWKRRRLVDGPIQPRYQGLLFSSALCVLFGIGYSPVSNIPARLPLGLDIISAVIPLWVFGGCWLLVGILGLITIYRRRKGAAVFAGQVAMYSIWTLGYTFAWVLSFWDIGEPRAWVSAGIFGVLTGMVVSFTRVDPPLWASRLGRLWTR